MGGRAESRSASGSFGPISTRHVAIAVVAGVAAAAAVWVTLESDFLAYPGWLAAQKADLILGPVLVGLYWVHVRPACRFGWLLIAYLGSLAIFRRLGG